MNSEIVESTLDENESALTAKRASLVKVSSRLGLWGSGVAASMLLLEPISGVSWPEILTPVFVLAAVVGAGGLLTAAVSVYRSLRPSQKLLRAATAWVAAPFGLGVATLFVMAFQILGSPSLGVTLAVLLTTGVLGIVLVILLVAAFLRQDPAEPGELRAS